MQDLTTETILDVMKERIRDLGTLSLFESQSVVDQLKGLTKELWRRGYIQSQGFSDTLSFVDHMLAAITLQDIDDMINGFSKQAGGSDD